MKKVITIEEKENGEVYLKVSKSIKWATFITAIEMLIEFLQEHIKTMSIDDILRDIKRIYERDRK